MVSVDYLLCSNKSLVQVNVVHVLSRDRSNGFGREGGERTDVKSLFDVLHDPFVIRLYSSLTDLIDPRQG